MIENAVLLALNAHQGQVRKGTKTPYIVHPLNVGIMLAQAGCTDEVIAAGILHDTIEDTYVTLEMVRSFFREMVAFIVKGCTERNKNVPWQERKNSKLESLKNAIPEVRMVSCADKLDNIRSMRALLKEQGDDTWNVFNAGYDLQKIYYHQLVRVLCNNPDNELNPELFRKLASEVEALFGKVRDERFLIGVVEDDELPQGYLVYLINNSNVDYEKVHQVTVSPLYIDGNESYQGTPSKHTYNNPLYASDHIVIDFMYEWDFDFSHTFDFVLDTPKNEMHLSFFLDRLFPCGKETIIPVLNQLGYICYPDKIRTLIKPSELDDIE